MNTLQRHVLARNAICAAAISFLLVALAAPPRTLGVETNVNLGLAANFAVLAGSGINNSTNIGPTVLVGNLGIWPGTNVSGLEGITIRGNTHLTDGTAQTAQTNLSSAYINAAARTNPIVVSGDVGGMTLPPGLYASVSSLEITSSDLTLDAQGNPAAVFIFQIASNLTVAADRQVVLAGAARAANIYWQIGDSATLGARSAMHGSILANQSITLESRATLDGRALARMGAVNLNANVITTPLGGTTNDVPVDVSVLTSIALNPQTGLFEQTIRAYNAGTDTNVVDPLIVLIRGLPSDVRVYNASGADSGGTPFVAYRLPLRTNESVDFVIEYYRSTRRIFTQPTFAPSMGFPLNTNISGGGILRAQIREVQSGAVLIEFTATPGKRYEVQYSADFITWKNATPTITAPADKVQWIDSGPPKTESPPGMGSRFYRVAELP
jgi:hypothetical protein